METEGLLIVYTQGSATGWQDYRCNQEWELMKQERVCTRSGVCYYVQVCTLYHRASNVLVALKLK
jgi:hypothetical protein